MAANKTLSELVLPTLPEDTIASFIGYRGELFIKRDVFCGKSVVYTRAVTYGIGDIKSIIAADPDFIITDLTKLIILLS